MTKIERLKIKCNDYAKRLVSLGEDDVSWEITGKFINKESPAIPQQPQGEICPRCNKPMFKCDYFCGNCMMSVRI